jgi:hypothetical protein
MKTQWMSSWRHTRRSKASTEMSSIATRFLAQIRRNIESWRADEIDYVTFIESQRDTWAGIQAAGRQVEAEVLRALTGAPRVAHLLMLEDREHRTVQLPRCRRAGPPSARPYCGVVGRTATGSPMLSVLPADTRSRHAEHRQVAALIYEIAADMERHSHQLQAHWTIAVDAENGQVVIELTGEHEVDLAAELVANIMTDHQLI